MKKGLHPQYYPNAKVTCACGNTWETGSTQKELRTDVCNQCHPFFTGKVMRLVDSTGQVERFTQRVERARTMRQEAADRAKKRGERARARALVQVVDEADEVEPIEGLGSKAG
jgi:large subunit ribosomal protein L31